MSESLYGPATGRRVTTRDLAAAKERGEKWPMITAYDAGDREPVRRSRHSRDAGRRFRGHGRLRPRPTIPVTVDELIPGCCCGPRVPPRDGRG